MKQKLIRMEVEMEHEPIGPSEELKQIIWDEVQRAVKTIDLKEIQKIYLEQNECVFLEQFLPPVFVERYLIPEVEGLRRFIHRNYIPMHKKGGSVSYYEIIDRAPALLALYRSPAFMEFLNLLFAVNVMPCPEMDPHACALYFYTEPGDHIGFHYDTSYYKGSRYTVLLGLIERSEQCRLICHLFKGDPNREVKEIQLQTLPGSLVLFNGDKLWHAISPLAKGEERVVLTMEYVTNPEMGPFKRFVSNMKDAIAYFGLSGLRKGAGIRDI